MGEEIAEGGEGAVHQAKWLTTPVAIKLIRGRFNSEILTECKTLQWVIMSYTWIAGWYYGPLQSHLLPIDELIFCPIFLSVSKIYFRSNLLIHRLALYCTYVGCGLK